MRHRSTCATPWSSERALAQVCLIGALELLGAPLPWGVQEDRLALS
jgi:hypothetical protein